MEFRDTKLAGAFLVLPDRFEDERGFFARTFSREEFEVQGLEAPVAQCAISFNRWKATLRGMHYQVAPFAQAKLVRCTRGALFDVIVDLRPESPTFGSWFAATLVPDMRALYAPRGVAHGFETLEDDTEVYYQMSAPYHPPSERGVRWDDPAFAIEWPLEPVVLAARDREFKPFDATGR
jgi:dTDP-4-dehydrorhamnose 3,5-epimerase